MLKKYILLTGLFSCIVVHELCAETVVEVDIGDAMEIATTSGYTMVTKGDGDEVTEVHIPAGGLELGSNHSAESHEESDMIRVYHLDDEVNEESAVIDVGMGSGAEPGRQVQGHVTITTVTRGSDGAYKVIVKEQSAKNLFEKTNVSQMLKQMLASIKGMVGVPTMFAGLPMLEGGGSENPEFLNQNDQSDIQILDASHQG